MAARSEAARLGRGEAGRQGEKVRSDLHVSVELTGDGGVQLELQSRVEPYYGDSLREQLASRYLYEHLYLAHLVFDAWPEGPFFRLVRSRTPPGQPVDEIASRTKSS